MYYGNFDRNFNVYLFFQFLLHVMGIGLESKLSLNS